VLEGVRCVLLYFLEVVKGGVCLLEALEVPEVIRCMLVCMLEALWRVGSVCWMCWRSRRSRM
jgi:hypothetical protein